MQCREPKATVTIAILAVLLLPLASSAQRRPGDEVRLSSVEVALDLVVRDGRGRPVTDLVAEDVEIYENGVRQELVSFQLVEDAGRTASAMASGRATPPGARESGEVPRVLEAPNGLSAMALAFDRLSLPARVSAVEAAREYLEQSLTGDDLVGIFSIERTLAPLQGFTNDAAAIERALARLSTTSTAAHEHTGMGLSSVRRGGTDGWSGSIKTEAFSRPGEVGNRAEILLARMQQRMERGVERMELEMQANETADGLLVVIDALAAVPGRKALVLFSEGLLLPTSTASRFRQVIAAANRAHVSIYAVDAAGLRVTGENQITGGQIRSAAHARMEMDLDNPDGPLTRDLERTEELTRRNPETGLGLLANETGGVFINNANDIGRRVQDAISDMRTYYVASYIPTAGALDGTFRAVTVKVRRKNLTVQSRSGYYAVPDLGTVDMKPYEAPALAFLASGSTEMTLGLRAAGFGFRGKNGRGLVSVLAEVPAGELAFEADPTTGGLTSDLTILALLRDRSGEVVGKASERYAFRGKAADLNGFKKGQILFFRDVPVDPGTYTLEVVAVGADSSRRAMRRSTVEVPSSDGSVALSSPMIVMRAERLTGDVAAEHLRHEDLLLYPNLGSPVRKEVRQLTFAVTLYPAVSGPTPALTLEVLDRDAVVARLPIDLPRPEPSGAYKVVNAIPTSAVAPGRYTLRLTASDGRTSVSRSVSVEVVP